jgi:hypothetical protein
MCIVSAVEFQRNIGLYHDKAVEEYRRRRFWDQVEAAASDLRSDSAGWQEEQIWRRAWEVTRADDLEDE